MKHLIIIATLVIGLYSFTDNMFNPIITHEATAATVTNSSEVTLNYEQLDIETKAWVDEIRQDILFEIYGSIETLSTKDLLKVMDKPIVACNGVGSVKCGNSYAYSVVSGRYIDFMLYPENIKVSKSE